MHPDSLNFGRSLSRVIPDVVGTCLGFLKTGFKFKLSLARVER